MREHEPLSSATTSSWYTGYDSFRVRAVSKTLQTNLSQILLVGDAGECWIPALARGAGAIVPVWGLQQRP